MALHEKVKKTPLQKVFEVKLTYITTRGNWYFKSWKGIETKSGGVATNIGIHFYDMLQFIFGRVKKNEVHYRNKKTLCGYLEYERARVRWFLSIDDKYVPKVRFHKQHLTFRSIEIEDEKLEFSDGFEELHTLSYMKILNDEGFDIEDNRIAIETVSEIRNAPLVKNPKNTHPLYKELIK